MDRKGNWISTYCMKRVYPFDPRMDEICIEDIAHALSNICRFTGHCSEFYSVAQHSVYVSVHVNQKNAMCGLLHDAAEAYLNDIARPVKIDIRMHLYAEAEVYLRDFILAKFGVNTGNGLPDEVIEIDNKMITTEARDLGLW